MTENQLQRRYSILECLLSEKRSNYLISLDNSFILIRNIRTGKGIYTDSLQVAKRWISKDIKLN